MRKRKKKWVTKLLWLALLVCFIVGVRYVYTLKKQVAAVNQWENLVSQITTEHGISNYKDVVMAIIFTETKGKHLDVMQSSESKYGEQNQIASSEESIQSGVQHLSEVLSEGAAKKVDVWTAVQAYNFGINYINYVVEDGGVNSIALAEKYSRDYLAPVLGNKTGQTYRYLTPVSIKNNQRYLYVDGGNYLYAEEVQQNMKIMKFFESLPF